MKEEVQRGNTALAVKAGFWYVASTFLIRSMAFITTPIFARIMSEEAYGEFSNFASWRSTLLILTGAELYNTLNPAYYDYKDRYDQYVSSVTMAGCILTAVLYGVFLLCGDFIFRFVAIPPAYVHVLFFTLMCASCKNVFLARERTLYRYKPVAAISILDVLVPTLVSVAFVLMAAEPDRLSARVYGFYVPSALIGLFCGGYLIFRGRTLKVSHCSYAFKLAIPLLVHYLTVYLLTSTNTIITKNVLGPAITAIVSIATSVIHILTILFQSATGAVTTWMMDNLEKKDYAKIRKGMMVYMGALVVISMGVMLLAPEIVWILGGKKYAAATALIPGLVVSVLIQTSCTLFTIILTYDKKVAKTAVYTGIIAVLSIIGKTLLLPVLGLQSLPGINIAAYLILFAVNYSLVCKAGFGKTINLKGFCIAILSVFVMLAVSFVLYRHTAVRYGVILTAGVIAVAGIILKKDAIMTFLRNRKNRKK